MADHTLIDDYLDALRARLAWRRDVDDVLAEAADHLHNAAARLETNGATHVHAQRQALERFGDPKTLARAFATTPSGGTAVPTTFTRTAGTIALVSGILWTTAGVAWLLSRSLELNAGGDWLGAPETTLRLSGLALVTAAALTVTVMVALHQRHGHFGRVGVAGIAVAGVGAVSALMFWAHILWGGLLAVGTALVAAAMRSRDLAPRPATITFGCGLAVGAVLWSTLRALEVGSPTVYGDLPARRRDQRVHRLCARRARLVRPRRLVAQRRTRRHRRARQPADRIAVQATTLDRASRPRHDGWTLDGLTAHGAHVNTVLGTSPSAS